MLQTTLF